MNLPQNSSSDPLPNGPEESEVEKKQPAETDGVSNNEASGDTYALAKPEPSVRSVRTHAPTNPSQPRYHKCPDCGQSYEVSTLGCPLCGWGEKRRQGRSTKTASWFTILAAGFNVRMVGNAAASMVGHILGWAFLLGIALVLIVATTAAPQTRQGGLTILFLVSILVTIHLASVYCRSFYSVLKSSATGYYSPNTEDTQRGLMFYVAYSVVASFLLGPVIFFTTQGVQSLWAQQKSTEGLILGGTGLVAVLLFSPMYLLRATLTQSIASAFNPLKAMRWLFCYPLRFTGVVFASLLWSIVFVAMAVGLSASLFVGAALAIGGEWDDLPALEQALADSLKEPQDAPEKQDPPLGEAARIERAVRAAREHPEIVRDAWKRVVERIQHSEDKWYFLAAGVFAYLITTYLIYHAQFTIARMLGLFAQRYQTRLGWSE